MNDEIKTAAEDHAAQRAKLEALFRSRPRQEIEADELEALVGPNYRSRISELHTKHGMNFKNCRRTREENGKIHRLSGAYLYLDYEPLGRDASKPTQPVDVDSCLSSEVFYLRSE